MEAPLAPPSSEILPSDEELMQRVQSGDQTAYHMLFQRHHARVYGYLLRRSRDPQLAADLYQETFLSVYRSRETWHAGKLFRPWLFTIAANAARDHARKVKRLPVEAELEEWQSVVRDRPDARLHLERAIAGLPDTLRDAFLLGVVEGFDHNEVAGLLGISSDNARARISRARAWLRAWLSESQ